MSRRSAAALRAAVTAVPVLFLGVFFVYPVAGVIVEGLTGEGAPSVVDLARSPRFRGIVWFTVWQAAASTVLSLAAGLPAAALVARVAPRWQRLIRGLVIVPFVLSPVPQALRSADPPKCETARTEWCAPTSLVGPVWASRAAACAARASCRRR